MKKLVFLLMIVALFCGCKKSDPEPDPTQSLVGWAVGSTRDHLIPAIIKTTDGGQNWNLQTVDNNAPAMSFTHVTAFSDNVCWVMGQEELTKLPVIYKTEDGGLTWKRQALSLNFKCEFKGLVTPDGTHLIAQAASVGAQYIMLSNDGGERWTYKSLDAPEGYYYRSQSFGSLADCSLIVSSGTLVEGLEGKDRMCYTSTDYGQTWKALKVTEDSEIHGWMALGLAVLDKSTIYISAEDIMRSTDAANHFSTILEAGFGHYNGLYATDANRLCAVLDPAKIIYTENGGKTWDEAKIPIEVSGVALMQVVFLQDGKTGLCTGSNTNGSATSDLAGAIIRTVDGGKTWTMAHQSEDYRFYGISFVQTKRR